MAGSSHDTHLVVWSKNEPDPTNNRVTTVTTVGGETLLAFRDSRTVPEEELCPKCQEGIKKFRAENGYKYFSRYIRAGIEEPPAPRHTLPAIPRLDPRRY
jgi:SMC interacting uncharacterized protein involved in chromosome segregation